MVFNVKVRGGSDDGKSFRVEGPCIVGRAPRCQVNLTEPGIAWEHALLQDQMGRLFLQNLSAVGTRLQGRPVSAETRVVHGDEIALTGTCSLLVEERIGQRRGPQLTLPLALGLLLALGALTFAAFLVLRDRQPTVPPMTLEHWRTAFERLEGRMGEWEARGEFPSEALVIFRDGWRYELAYNNRAAAERWDVLGAVLLTLPLPGAAFDRRTIAEAGGPTPRALHVLMDWDPDTSLSMDSQWRTDEAFANALGWFVRQRSARAKEKLEEGE